MATYKVVEEMEVFIRSRLLVKEIYKKTSEPKINKDYSLKDQMQRSSVSILSNIAEGFDRGSDKDFVKFLYISKGSLSELRAQLMICNDLGYINDAAFNELNNECLEIGKMIGKLITYLKNSDYKSRGVKAKWV